MHQEQRQEGAHACDLEHAAQALARGFAAARMRRIALLAHHDRDQCGTDDHQDPATARNVARQPIAALAQASGAVTSSVPIVPMPIWMPASAVNRSGGKRRA